MLDIQIKFIPFDNKAQLPTVFPYIDIRVIHTDVWLSTFVQDIWVVRNDMNKERIMEALESMPWTAQVKWEWRRAPHIGGGGDEVHGFIPLLKSSGEIKIPDLVHATD